MNYNRKLIIVILAIITTLVAQKHKISGTIYDEVTKDPIANVNILVNDTDIGTSSSEYGTFSIILNKDFPIDLQITHIGYEDMNVVIKDETTLDIYLIPTILMGDEVIIEGVQRHSKREVSSKIEVVELKEIDQRGVRDVSEILNELEGVNISTTSYGAQTISVRGSNSNEVAVYLDGIKLNNSASGSADLAYIDLSDLAEIEVIKGGSSTLFGAGNFGGVVLLHSKKPQINSIEYNRGFGVTDNNDQDLSIGGNIKIGPLGGYGRYSGKSRLFDGRTLFTSVFGNYGALLSFKNQELAYKHVDFDKYIEFPSGEIVSADELMVDRITFIGNIFGSSGWDIQYGLKKWEWDDTFYTYIERKYTDEAEQYRINKGFNFYRISGSLQLEREVQVYTGDQFVEDGYDIRSWNSTGTLKQTDNGLAAVLRYDVHDPADNINMLRWEGGVRYGSVEYEQEQLSQEFVNQTELLSNQYNLKDTVPLSTYRLGLFVDGKTNKFDYKLHFSQGYNNRLPTLNDRFQWADAAYQLEEDYRRLKEAYFALGGPQEIEEQMNTIQKILGTLENELEKEFITTTEVNSSLDFNITNSSIDKLEIGAAVFRNSFINKIAYYSLENDRVVPYNTNTAWLNGAEVSGEISLFKKLINIDANITWVQPSDQEIFPNKPSSTGSVVVDIRKNWFRLNVSHIFNGPQYYIRGGVSIEQLERQKNTNLTASIDFDFWLLDATLSYTVRNLFSDEVTVVTAGTQAGNVFNYYDANREIINLKISLSDKK